MAEIYWMTRIGELNLVFGFLWFASCAAIGVMLLALPIFVDGDDFKDMLKKWLWRIVVVMVIGIIGDVLTPSKKEMMLIYGVGGTIDYIKSNDKAKELPDKVVDALTRYVDSIESEQKDSKK